MVSAVDEKATVMIEMNRDRSLEEVEEIGVQVVSEVAGDMFRNDEVRQWCKRHINTVHPKGGLLIPG